VHSRAAQPRRAGRAAGDICRDGFQRASRRRARDIATGHVSARERGCDGLRAGFTDDRCAGVEAGPDPRGVRPTDDRRDAVAAA